MFDGTNIMQLEQQLDRCLARPRVAVAARPSLAYAAGRWSAAVWDQAAAAGPIELAAGEVSQAFEVAQRPVFIFGAHRSGTTLVRDLLDSHPALAVMPAEGTFFTNLEHRLCRSPQAQWLQDLACEWLRRLANPIHQEPYWLLGASTAERSPYVEFARAAMAWWPLTQERLARVVSSWPLVAMALAYAHCTTGFARPARLQRWAEKTPTNERFLDKLRAEFPDAKLIHVVRHPFAVYASHKREKQVVGQPFRAGNRVLRDLGRSYRVALEQARGAPGDYMLVRTEDLLESTPSTVERLAAFLEIEPHPVLLRPTAAGLPVPSNSSYTAGGTPGRVYPAHRRWTETLTRFECARVTAAVGERATALGYRVAPLAPWRARLLRLTAGFTAISERARR